MNESRHNKYIKTISVKVPSDLKLKTAISRFVFQIFPVHKLRWFVSSNWIYSLMKNKSAKLQFVAKNSKHLVGTSDDDSSALIEFTPLWNSIRIKHNETCCWSQLSVAPKEALCKNLQDSSKPKSCSPIVLSRVQFVLSFAQMNPNWHCNCLTCS